MDPSVMDIQSRFVHALRTQASSKLEPRMAGFLPCPYGHAGEVYQGIDHLLGHARAEHASEFRGLSDSQSRRKLLEAMRPKQAERQVPDISGLSLKTTKERRTLPSSGKKRRADSEPRAEREKTPSDVESPYTGYMRSLSFAEKSQKPRPKPHDARIYNPKQGSEGDRPSVRSFPETTSERPRTPNSKKSLSSDATRQPGLIELQKYDPRYPGLLLQPDSRPISQEQLASEVKSIYAGLTMVETKCIHVDRAHAVAPQDSTQKLAPNHWQALIALHRILLHEHHDFFRASQHPSASFTLRRLAAKSTIPAQIWKHGIHSFLELLRRRILEASLDYMFAFIYQSCQMIALLSEVEPAFENTWDECPDDLRRYKVAVEDEEIDLLGTMTRIKPPEEDYSPPHNTRFITPWPSDRLCSVGVWLRSSLEGGLASLHAAPGLLRALAYGLLVQQVTAALNTQPSSVAAETESSSSTLGSLLMDKTPFDYIMYGVVVLYLGGTWLAERLAYQFSGPATSQRVRGWAKYCSLALTTFMAFLWLGIMDDRLAAGIYVTVIKIWAVTTFHFVLVDCCDAVNPNFHVAKFIGLAVLFEFIGMAMQPSAASSTLKALPPALTTAAIINRLLYVLTNHVPLSDAEQGAGSRSEIHNDVPGDDPAAVQLNDRSGHQQTGVVDNAAQARRRSSLRLVDIPTISDSTPSGNNSVVTRCDAVSHVQQTDAVENAARLGQNNHPQQNRHEDPRFTIGDGFDDVSLHHE